MLAGVSQTTSEGMFTTGTEACGLLFWRSGWSGTKRCEDAEGPYEDMLTSLTLVISYRERDTNI